MADDTNEGPGDGDVGLRLAAPRLPPRQQQTRPNVEVAVDEVHLLDYVRVLHKRRWTVLTVFLLVFVGVTVYTFTATRVFEATLRLLIEPDERNIVSFKQVIDEDQAKADYYQTQYNILQSRALARKTIDTLQLWADPQINPDAARRGIVAETIAKVTSLFDRQQRPPLNAAAQGMEMGAQSKATDEFLRHLSVVPIRNSRLVDLKYQSPDPKAAAAIVNTLAASYIEQNLEYKFMSSKDASDWLAARLTEQRKKVEASELALQRYREQNDALSLEQKQDITVQKLSDLNSAVTKAKTERMEKEAMHIQLRGIEKDRAALDTFPAILANGFIQQQKSELASLQRQLAAASEKFGDKHPEIIRVKSSIDTADAKLQGEIAKVVQSVRNEFLAAQAQENSLVNALNQQKAEALAMNRKGIEYGVLQRDAESNHQIYDSLMQRAKETGVSGELKTSNIRVIDRAEPPLRPARPRTLLNLVLGLLGGAFLGFGFAFFFEYLDSRIKTPDELKLYLRLPSLGMIPALDPKAWKNKQPLIHAGVPPHFIEAFRSIRSNVLFATADEGSRSVVITSTGPGEGKTTVVVNLAIGFAQAGQRVLLIDGDMRRPRVHEMFGQPQEPGLSNVMVGNAKASEAVRKSGVPGLWLLPAGRIPPNPAELIGSQRFRDFLGSLKEHFDWVLIDSPPVMAVADAVIAANFASGVVFVVGAEMTSRYAARSAVDQLETGRARFVGAVLNRVELEKNAYYYSHYYRREYGSYYQRSANSR